MKGHFKEANGPRLHSEAILRSGKGLADGITGKETRFELQKVRVALIKYALGLSVCCLHSKLTEGCFRVETI